MPYLNLDLHYFEHRKTKRLVGLLGRGAEVLPIKLWAYCGRVHAEDGRLTGYTAEEIESLVGWWGNAGRMVEAMLTVGFLKCDGEGFFVHEWAEHEGHIINFHRRARAGAAKRWGLDASSNATSNARLQLKQCPKPTKPTNTPPKPPEGASCVGFDSFWTAFPRGPRKVGRPKCLTKWRRDGLEPHTDAILRGLERWKASKHWADGFVCQPHRFLNERFWEAEPEAGEPADTNGFERRDLTPDDLAYIDSIEREIAG